MKKYLFSLLLCTLCCFGYGQQTLKISISDPANGDSVITRTRVKGTVSDPNAPPVYLFVKTEAGTIWCQGRVIVDPVTGDFDEFVSFADLGNGCGQNFTIYAASTPTVVPVGPDNKFPSNAVFSSRIDVVKSIVNCSKGN